MEVLLVNCHFRTQRQGFGFNLFHGLNGNLLLLNSLDALFQFGKFLFAFLSLKSQNTKMFLVFAFLLPLDAMLQHDCCECFFLFLHPQITLCQRSPLTGNALIGKCLFQRNTGG